MMYLLLVLSIVMAVVKSSIYNNYAKKESPDMGGIFRFNAVSYGVAVIVALCCGIGVSLSAATVFSAIFYALIVCSLQGLSVYAMRIGPMSATTLMVLYGMIIPSIAGPIFWKEKFGLMQGIGILLVLASMWLLRDNGTENKSASKKWGFFAIICFFLSGFAGLAEKIHQSTDGRNERTMFLFIAYLIMFLISVVGIIITKKNSKKAESLKSVTVNGGISGIIIGFYALINLTLAGNLDSMIYYPVANGGALILTVLMSVAVFKEKCTKRYIGGFIIGFLSIMLLSLGG